jgi:hypothetical protein
MDAQALEAQEVSYVHRLLLGGLGSAMRADCHLPLSSMLTLAHPLNNSGMRVHSGVNEAVRCNSEV